MTFQQMKDEAMKDPEFRLEYEALAPEFAAMQEEIDKQKLEDGLSVLKEGWEKEEKENDFSTVLM